MKGLCPLNKYVEYGLSRWIYYKYRNIKKNIMINQMNRGF